MSFIWEHYSLNTFYQVEEKICPYMEVFDQNSCLQKVNPLIRFSNLFASFFGECDDKVFAFDCLKEKIGQTGVDQIVNILFHYLAQLDMTKGFDKYQQIIELLRNEIDKGLWGNKIKNLLEEMSEGDQVCILYILARRMIFDSKSFFMDAMGKLFPISSLCYEEKSELFYLYIGSEKNNYNEKKLELVISIFWTISKKLRVIWDYHYGIIGNDETMRINNIQVV